MDIESDRICVTSILFSEVDECIDGFQIVFMLLDLDNHFLEAIDGLVAAFLRELFVEIVLCLVLGALGNIAGFVFVLVGNIVGEIGRTILDGLQPGLSAGLLIDIAAGLVVRMFVGGTSTSFLGVGLSGSTLGGVLGDTLSFLLGSTNRAIFAALRGREFVLGLTLHLAERWRGLVPSMVGGRFVNLVESLLVGAKLLSCVLGSIGRHVAAQEGDVLK